MPATTPRVETFAIEDDHLIRKVVPRRGEPYEHRCPLDAYRELAWAAIDLAADGFTIETPALDTADRAKLGDRCAVCAAVRHPLSQGLADQVRSRSREVRDDRDLSACNAQAEPWASYTNAAVAIAFWKERGLLDLRRRRNYVDDGFFFEDAMIEFHALAETCLRATHRQNG